MKRIKRLLSIWMAMVILMTSVPVAFAETGGESSTRSESVPEGYEYVAISGGAINIKYESSPGVYEPVEDLVPIELYSYDYDESYTLNSGVLDFSELDVEDNYIAIRPVNYEELPPMKYSTGGLLYLDEESETNWIDGDLVLHPHYLSLKPDVNVEDHLYLHSDFGEDSFEVELISTDTSDGIQVVDVLCEDGETYEGRIKLETFNSDSNYTSTDWKHVIVTPEKKFIVDGELYNPFEWINADLEEVYVRGNVDIDKTDMNFKKGSVKVIDSSTEEVIFETQIYDDGKFKLPQLPVGRFYIDANVEFYSGVQMYAESSIFNSDSGNMHEVFMTLEEGSGPVQPKIPLDEYSVVRELTEDLIFDIDGWDETKDITFNLYNTDNEYTFVDEITSEGSHLSLPELATGNYDLNVEVDFGELPSEIASAYFEIYLDAENGKVYFEEDLRLERNIFAFQMEDDNGNAVYGMNGEMDIQLDSGEYLYGFANVSDDKVLIEDVYTDGLDKPVQGRFRIYVNDGSSYSDAYASEWIYCEINEQGEFIVDSSEFNNESWEPIIMEDGYKYDYIRRDGFDEEIDYGYINIIEEDGMHRYPIDCVGGYYYPVLDRNTDGYAEVVTQSGNKYTSDVYIMTWGTSVDIEFEEFGKVYTDETIPVEIQLEYDSQPLGSGNIEENIPVSVYGSVIVDGETINRGYFKVLYAENGLLKVDLPPGSYELEVNEDETDKYGVRYSSNPLYSSERFNIETSLDGDEPYQLDDFPVLWRNWIVFEPVLPEGLQGDMDAVFGFTADAVDIRKSDDQYTAVSHIEFDQNTMIETEAIAYIYETEVPVVHSDRFDISFDKESGAVLINGELVDTSIIQKIEVKEAAFSGSVIANADVYDKYGRDEVKGHVKLTQNEELIYRAELINNQFHIDKFEAGQYQIQAFDDRNLLESTKITTIEIDEQGNLIGSELVLEFESLRTFNEASVEFIDEQGDLQEFNGYIYYQVRQRNEDGSIDHQYSLSDDHGKVLLPNEPGEYIVRFDYTFYNDSTLYGIGTQEIEVTSNSNESYVFEAGKIILKAEVDAYCTKVEINSEYSESIDFIHNGEVFQMALLKSDVPSSFTGTMKVFDIDEGEYAPTNPLDFYYSNETLHMDGMAINPNQLFRIDMDSGNVDGIVDIPRGIEETEVKIIVEETSTGDLVDYNYSSWDEDFSFNLGEGEYAIYALLGNEYKSNIEYITIDENGDADDDPYLELSKRNEDAFTVIGTNSTGEVVALGADVSVEIMAVDGDFFWEEDTNAFGQVELPSLDDGEYELSLWPDLPEWSQYSTHSITFEVIGGAWSIDDKSVVIPRSIYAAHAGASVNLKSNIRFEIDSNEEDGHGTSSTKGYIRLDELDGEELIRGQIRIYSVANDANVAASDWRDFKYENEKFYIDGDLQDPEVIQTWVLPDAKIKGLVYGPTENEKIDGYIEVFKNDLQVETVRIRKRRIDESEVNKNTFFLGELDPGEYTVRAVAYDNIALGIEEYSNTVAFEVDRDGNLVGNAPELRFEESKSTGEVIDIRGRYKSGSTTTLSSDIHIYLKSEDDGSYREYVYPRADGSIALPELNDGKYSMWIYPDFSEWMEFTSLTVDFEVVEGISTLDDTLYVNEAIHIAQINSEWPSDAVYFEIDVDEHMGIYGDYDSFDGTNFFRTKGFGDYEELEGRLRAVSLSVDCPVVSSEWRDFTFSNGIMTIEGQAFDSSMVDEYILPKAQLGGKVSAQDYEGVIYGRVSIYKDDQLIGWESIRDFHVYGGDDDSLINSFYIGNLESGAYEIQAESYLHDQVGIKPLSNKVNIVLDASGEYVGSAPHLVFEKANNEQDQTEKPVIKFSLTLPTALPVSYWIEADNGAIVEVRINGGEWSTSILSGELSANATIEARAKFGENNPWSEIAKAQVTWIDTEKPHLKPSFETSTVNTSKFTFTVEATDNVAVKHLTVEFDGQMIRPNADGVYTVVLEEGENDFDLMAVDAAGNIDGKSFTVTFDKAATPLPKITVSTSEPTNQDVTYTVTASEGTQILVNINEAGWKPYSGEGVLKENGSIQAKAQLNDDGEWSDVATHEVKNIDKTAPKLSTVKYSTNGPTNKDVIATINASEAVTGNLENVFTENGKHTFTVKDAAGNEASVKLK